MRWTGVIVLLFLILHLADLTWGLHPIATAVRSGATPTAT